LVVLKRIGDGNYLIRPSEVIVVDELGRGWVAQREIEAESGVVEEKLGWVGSLSDPLKFAEHEDVAESRSADRQVQGGVP
jgi:hypothetical protein